MERGQRSRRDWRNKHLRACICGRAWQLRRGRTCPACGTGIDQSIWLTYDRARPEAATGRCSLPGENLRRLVQACTGDWEWASLPLRRLAATSSGPW